MTRHFLHTQKAAAGDRVTLDHHILRARTHERTRAADSRETGGTWGDRRHVAVAPDKHTRGRNAGRHDDMLPAAGDSMEPGVVPHPPAHVSEAAAAALRDVEADLRSLDPAPLEAEDLAWSPESPAGFSFSIVTTRRDVIGNDVHVTGATSAGDFDNTGRLAER